MLFRSPIASTQQPTNKEQQNNKTETKNDGEIKPASTNPVATGTQGQEVKPKVRVEIGAEQTPAKATDLSEVKGLMYTIQVGVYSKPVTTAQIKNIQPLFVERTANGLYKYTTGSYNEAKIADAAKNKIAALGIRDAFVCAYLNGKRISVEQAEKEKADGKVQIAENKEVKNPTPSPVNNSNPVIANTSTYDPNGLIYSVQLGAFKNDIPLEMANAFIKLSSKKGSISNQPDENGMTIYTIGSFNNYNDAQKFKTEIVDAGVKDAFVIALKEGKKVPLPDNK